MDGTFKNENQLPERRAPLRQKRPEQFAWAFAQHFDPERAALEAGYERYPKRAWPRLISVPVVQARIRTWMSRRAYPVENPKTFFTQLFDDYHCSFADLVVRDPMTGETSVDLGRASEQQLALIDIRYRETSGPNGISRHIDVRIPSRQSRLGPLIKHFGLDKPRPEPGEDRFESFLESVRQYAAVPFPVATQSPGPEHPRDSGIGRKSSPNDDDQ